MHASPLIVTAWTVRRVFASWSVTLPTGLREPPIEDDAYWHAHDDDHSVSLSSIVLTDRDGPVPAVAIARYAFSLIQRGDPVSEGPGDLLWKARMVDADQPARASRSLSGVVAAEGRLLVATITSDDPGWALSIWRSIEHHDVLPITRPPTKNLAIRAARPGRRRR